MGKFQEQQNALAERNAVRKDSEKTGRETLGKYYYDLSKLSFATSVLNGSGLLFSEAITTDRVVSMCFGVFLTVGFAMLGFRTIKIK